MRLNVQLYIVDKHTNGWPPCAPNLNFSDEITYKIAGCRAQPLFLT